MQLETEARAIESFRRCPQVLRLVCGVQHYEWGDPRAIPAILGRPNPQGQPVAELWAGAHPDLPAQAIVKGVQVPLDLLMRDAAKEILGPPLAARFHGELPFLLKILAAAKPLSIQAHPNRAQALLGFERENLEGLPLDAATRNYRDRHHKPELLVALSEFYALRGFRPLVEIEQTLASTPELASLTPKVAKDAEGLAVLYRHIMDLSQPEASALLGPLVDRLAREDRRRAFAPLDPPYWILRAHRELSTPGRHDRGLFSILLLNLVRLRPGQAIFLAAGELHAYLQGVGIEIMANSNNVLRGGLTTKHIDIEELLHVLTFNAGPAEVLEPRHRPETPWLDEYETPAAEFALSRLELVSGHARSLHAGEMRLALVTAGSVNVQAEGSMQLRVRPGEALLVPAGLGCAISAREGAQLWLAKVPEREPRTARR
jgi:mannose-6-phosphate isomerase class I